VYRAFAGCFKKWFFSLKFKGPTISFKGPTISGWILSKYFQKKYSFVEFLTYPI
jgi:hypothetical protein